MASTKDVQIKIKILDTGRAEVQISKLGKEFMSTADAARYFNEQIKQQDEALEGTVGHYRRQIADLKVIRDNTAKTSAEYSRQSKKILELQQAQRKLTSEVSDSIRVNEDQISSAGLAGATLTELGRTISDLPFGVNAITNNLSQLASLFVTLIAKTNGATRALKLLGKQLKGPLGIIILFQIAIALLQKFAGNTKKAEDSINSLKESLKDTEAALVIFSVAMEAGLFSAQQNAEAVALLNEEYEELNLKLDEFGNLSEESVEQLRNFTDQQLASAVASSIVKDMVELSKQKLIEQAKATRQGATAMDGFKVALRALNVGSGGGLFGMFRTNAEKSRDAIGELEDQILDLGMALGNEKLLEALRKLFATDGPGSKREKVFPIDVPEYTNQAEIMYKLLEDMLKKEQEFAQKIDKSVKETASAGIKAFGEFAEARQKMLNRQEELRKAELAALEERKRVLLAMYETMKQASSALFDAEITREERKTQLMNNQLRERLKNEKLTASQRQNLEKQIYNNEERLAKRRDALAEKQFKIQKAIAIGEALIMTYKMANSAYFALLNSPVTFIGWDKLVQAKIAAGIATAFGLANVAAIARQQFVPSSVGDVGGAAGAGGAGRSIEAPDFNVVGASAQNQLAETVAGAEAQPVRAYVVGKDITTQQELDRNITNTASFG